MNNSRPKNLNLFTIRFPIPAIISILHRLSGVFLFLLIPFLLWGLAFSLTAHGFVELGRWLSNFYVKFVFWLLLVPFCYHFTAGIKHLLMDIHIGSNLRSGRLAAQLTLIISAILAILVGIWLW